MESAVGDLLPRAELRGLIGHLRSRAFLLVAIFGVGFIGGYPLAGRAIEILLDSSDYRPDGVEVIILHPMEAVLLRLRICLLYTSPSPRDKRQSRMPSSA